MSRKPKQSDGDLIERLYEALDKSSWTVQPMQREEVESLLNTIDHLSEVAGRAIERALQAEKRVLELEALPNVRKIWTPGKRS